MKEASNVLLQRWLKADTSMHVLHSLGLTEQERAGVGGGERSGELSTLWASAGGEIMTCRSL